MMKNATSALAGAFIATMTYAGDVPAQPAARSAPESAASLVAACGDLTTEAGQRVCITGTANAVLALKADAKRGLDSADGVWSGIAYGQLEKDCRLSTAYYSRLSLAYAWDKSLTQAAACMNSIHEVESDRGWNVSKSGFNTLAIHIMGLRTAHPAP